jgi:hypothetical protein
MKTVSYEKNSLYNKRILNEIGLKKKKLGFKKTFWFKNRNFSSILKCSEIFSEIFLDYFNFNQFLTILLYLFKVISNRKLQIIITKIYSLI